MKMGHGCEDVSKCERGYIEGEEFEVPEGWEEIFRPWLNEQVIVLGNG